MNAWATLPKLFNFCWTPGGKKPFVSTHTQRQRNSCWHEAPGLAWPSQRTWLRAGAGRRQPFNLEQSSNGPQGIHSPAQRNQETPGAFHLPQSFRSSPARQLTCRCQCLRGIPEWRSLWVGLVKVLGLPQLVWGGRKRGFRALSGRDSCGASKQGRHIKLVVTPLKINKNIFEQEGAEETDIFIFRSPCSPRSPVQNSCVKRYLAKKEEMPVLEEKPGRYWGVIGRQHLPLEKREDREVIAARAVATKGIEPRISRIARIGKG